MKYSISATQRLSPLGVKGAILFLTTPLLSGIFLYWLPIELAKPSFVGQPAVPAVLLVLSSLLFLASCIMLLIGRTQTYQVHTESPEESRSTSSGAKPLWS
ncbi:MULTISPECIES: hypothetical protein [Agrobacterium]|uniref:Uncharacterized protein n=1 Tax=Agrobacterium salinitolerans TaxID=1183413 RepID=A0ABY3BW14_9HYPH|nr:MULTISPECIES: hypothetical protein [Agrobacterium]MCZ7886009.1 hypothetical protein [Agrobacterium salinitolerans]TRA97004.1 hypothetical protein EXN23_01865 [Agrobacterium salinitolerans]